MTKERWSRFIKSEGTLFHYENAFLNRERLSEYWNLDCPAHKNLADLIRKLGKPTLKLLDAGCGPFPKSGLRLNGFHIERTLMDALGGQYHQLLSELNIKTNGQNIINCELEKADDCFTDSCFDIVFAKNCIDHTYNPFEAIKSMVSITKIGGCIYLEHYKREGKYTGYAGLHQWNMTIHKGDLVISDKGEVNRINISEMIVPNSLEVYEQNNKIYAVIKKHE